MLSAPIAIRTAAVTTYSYADRAGWLPDFEVAYRIFTPEEGGRKKPPHQHTRWDFLYEGDDPETDRISMIWPEFIDASGAVLPEGIVPMSGRALMFIAAPQGRPYHCDRIRPGVRGYFVEGSRKVAACEVVAVLALHDNPCS